MAARHAAALYKSVAKRGLHREARMLAQPDGRGRSASLRVLTAIAYLIISASALAQQPNAVQPFSAQDAALVRAIEKLDTAAIAGGKVALSRNTPSPVRKYAQLVVDSHEKLREDRDKVAKLKGWHVTADPRSAGGDASLRLLREASDDQFARTYLEWSIALESEALELVRRATSQAQDPNFKALGANAASHIEPLTAIARELVEALTNGTLPATGKAAPR